MVKNLNHHKVGDIIKMIKAVRDTSIDTYTRLRDYLGDQAMQVYIYIDKHPNITRNEISKESEVNINAVCGRVNELIKQGLVKEGIKRKDYYTGNNVYTLHTITNIDWSLLDMHKLNKKKTKKQSIDYELIVTIHKVFSKYIREHNKELSTIKELNGLGKLQDQEVENIFKIHRITKGVHDKYK